VIPICFPAYEIGGPGGSGVNLAIHAAKFIQTIVDYSESPESTSSGSLNGKYYDVIGFDPRGVNNTTPRPGDCFPDDTSMTTWARQAFAQGDPHSNESFGLSWGRSRSLAKSCTWRWSKDDEDTIGRYLSTPSVAEDMVAIIEAMGEWREAQAKILITKTPNAARIETLQRVKWKKGKEKLYYWGYSYGTLLGATFVTLHPDRVGRVALDGVVDPDDYYASECRLVAKLN
jgi:pimeloyl-ACP methyl ester carboxylesterase